MAELLSACLVSALSVISPLPVLRTGAVLVPLPLHRQRLQERGYNQSALLAAAAAQRSGIPCREALRRSAATVPQAQLPLTLRAENVRGAFELLPGIPLAPRVLLIDDVLTSAATLSAAAEALASRPGVREVWGVTAAR